MKTILSIRLKRYHPLIGGRVHSLRLRLAHLERRENGKPHQDYLNVFENAWKLRKSGKFIGQITFYNHT